VKFDRFVVRLTLLDVNQKFTQHQILVTLDDENNTPTVMTQPRVLTNNGTRTVINPPAMRRFYVGDKTDFVILVIHFQSPSDTKCFVDVTSYISIERDLINPIALTMVSANTYRRSNELTEAAEEWVNAPSNFSHSTTTRPSTGANMAVFRRQ
jgi:hypothetical protein